MPSSIPQPPWPDPFAPAPPQPSDWLQYLWGYLQAMLGGLLAWFGDQLAASAATIDSLFPAG
jgi:hypothetical protein